MLGTMFIIRGLGSLTFSGRDSEPESFKHFGSSRKASSRNQPPRWQGLWACRPPRLAKTAQKTAYTRYTVFLAFNLEKPWIDLHWGQKVSNTCKHSEVTHWFLGSSSVRFNP